MTTDAALWREISPYLDEALSRDDEARAAWLADLQEAHPEVAAHVRELLNEHAELTRKQFMGADAADLLESPSLVGMQLGAYTLTAPDRSRGRVTR